ncbi:MAG: dihydroorotate dehydrogenase electron transfer subunit [Syntrophobacteraceae bacterium]|nr:dihydroorotate dehydrogenase electron transfer subunit [Syntrophobacteraceae bacterium]
MDKIIEEARIVYQERVLGQTFRLGLHSPEIVSAARPGQFVMVRVREGMDPLLRRPFSFSRIYPERGDFEILYRVVGRGSLLLSRLAPGEGLNLVGPLGNGFELPGKESAPLAFIAGGIGIAPLLELIARITSERGKKGAEGLRLFYGARCADELLPEDALRMPGLRVHFSTDDGSSGYKGRITRMFEEVLAEGEFRPCGIYSCGPLAMQHSVAKWALSTDTLAQLSMESLMACGIGACLGCALPASTPEDPGAERFVHVCEDGPIFLAGSIKWKNIPAQQTAPPTWPFN